MTEMKEKKKKYRRPAASNAIAYSCLPVSPSSPPPSFVREAMRRRRSCELTLGESSIQAIKSSRHSAKRKGSIKGYAALRDD